MKLKEALALAAAARPLHTPVAVLPAYHNNKIEAIAWEAHGTISACGRPGTKIDIDSDRWVMSICPADTLQWAHDNGWIGGPKPWRK